MTCSNCISPITNLSSVIRRVLSFSSHPQVTHYPRLFALLLTNYNIFTSIHLNWIKGAFKDDLEIKNLLPNLWSHNSILAWFVQQHKRKRICERTAKFPCCRSERKSVRINRLSTLLRLIPTNEGSVILGILAHLITGCKFFRI